jgi:branched-chain amino acid transport system ATP-binding protein
MSLLSVKNLHASYGQVHVLHGLNFELLEGEITTLLGANGAGKTTTIRALCNMVKTSGEIIFEGKPIQNLQTDAIVKLKIAHVPQGRGTFTRLTVNENLDLGAMTRTDKAEIAQDKEKMLTLFPILKRRITQQAGTLSGGEQQMLAVARALMLRPRLMLLDEPSFGLAPLIVKELFETLKDINRSQKVSMLVVEQNAKLALDLADKAYLIETGHIIMAGKAEDIKRDEAVKKAYLGH